MNKNNSSKRKSNEMILRNIIVILSLLFLVKCNDKPDELTLGEEYIESGTNLNLIDTFSVSLSTVIIDTIVTSGTDRMLVGNFNDNIFGKISSKSYFQIGIPDSFDVEEDEIYDSLVLNIKYDSYYFGDTTRIQKIFVHQLNENIDFNNGEVLTSHSSFNYNSTPVGTIAFYPEPNKTSDTLKIKISDVIGNDLFDKLKSNSVILSNNESFINYFHGFVLKEDDSYEGSIIGFKGNGDDVELILYTRKEVISTEKTKYEFRLEDGTKQFNNIYHDFSATQLNNLVEQRYELPSVESSGLTFLQGGIGLAIRIDFPSLQEILLFERGKIIQAQLYIKPLQNSYDDFKLPSKFYILETDNLNRINSPLYNNQNNIVSSKLNIDELYDEETTYSFDLTKYINDELADSYVDPEKGLLIMLTDGDTKASLDRLIVDTQNQITKLKIYYLYY